MRHPSPAVKAPAVPFPASKKEAGRLDRLHCERFHSLGSSCMIKNKSHTIETTFALKRDDEGVIEAGLLSPSKLNDVCSGSNTTN